MIKLINQRLTMSTDLLTRFDVSWPFPKWGRRKRTVEIDRAFFFYQIWAFYDQNKYIYVSFTWALGMNAGPNTKDDIDVHLNVSTWGVPRAHQRRFF